MSEGQGVKIEGADRLASTLHAAAREIGASNTAARVAAEAIGTTARARAPRRTGRLRASITVRSEAMGASVGTSLRYAPFVNYGTRHVAARPFLTGATETGSPLALAAYEQTVTKALGRVRGK